MKAQSVLKTIAWAFAGVLSCASVQAQMAPTPELMPASPSGKTAYEAAAENKFYVKVYGFYGLLSPGGFSGQGVPPSTSSTRSSGGITSRSTTKSSNFQVEKAFGSGLRVGGGIGMVLNDFINIGIDGEYLLGNTATESYTITSQSRTGNNPPTNTAVYEIRKDYSYRIVNIIPNITFKAVSKPQYYIYNRLGVCIGIPTQLSYTDLLQVVGADISLEAATDFDKNIGFGYQAALGVQFRIGERLRGFAEIVVSSVQINVNSKTLTSAQITLNGETEQLPVKDFEGNSELEVFGIVSQADNLNLKIPVASVGLGAGLAFRF